MALKDEQVKSILGNIEGRRNRKGLIFSDPDYIREVNKNTDEEVVEKSSDLNGLAFSSHDAMIIDVTSKNNDANHDKVVKFSALSGAQQKIVILIFDSCQKERSKISGQLTLEYLSDYGLIKYGSIKKSISRLEEKGYIERNDSKKGRGGWTVYKLHEKVFQEILMLQNQKGLFESFGLKCIDNSKVVDLGLARKDLSTISEDKSCGWASLDISPLQKYGFTASHLLQIQNDSKLTFDMVEMSIKAFVFDLEFNNKLNAIKDPVRYFMGILRKGNPYAPPSNYETEQDRAMRIFIEKQSEINDKAKKIEEKAIDLAFQDWVSKISFNERKSLLPSGIKLSLEMENIALKVNFEENEWQKIKSNIVSL